MNSYLVQFLRSNLNEIVWCVIPVGAICGKLSDFDDDSHSFGLRSAIFFSGSAELELGDANISADQVSAWGLDKPDLATEE